MTDLQTIEQTSGVAATPAAAQVFAPASFLEDEGGQDLIEYALFAALVSLAAISAMRSLGSQIVSAFTTISSNLTSNT